jgi:tRNA threonylcarbamoyladenosine biosynthesis protein TsaE
MNELTVTCKGREDTAGVAAAISASLRPNDAVLLKGALASGKTAFVQDLVAALGSKAEVTSPTFTLAHFYPTPKGTLLHIDAYRLSSIAEFRDLALEDYFYESMTVVEWGEIVEADFPNALSINFEFVDSQDNWRKLIFSCSSERWKSVLEILSAELTSKGWQV